MTLKRSSFNKNAITDRRTVCQIICENLDRFTVTEILKLSRKIICESAIYKYRVRCVSGNGINSVSRDRDISWFSNDGTRG